jgi:diacylglycerol kinase
MDYGQSTLSLPIKPSSTQHVLNGVRKVFVSDPGLTLQLLLTLGLIAGGIALQLTALQWVLVGFVTFLFLMAGVFRRATLLQISRDQSISSFQVSRIKCMGNAIVTIMAGISLLTYLMVFIPKITPLL